VSTFSIQLAQLAAKVKADLDTTVRKSTLQVFSAVVQKTPVDTGRARANWNVSRGAPDATTTESTNQARGQEEAAKALNEPAGGVVYLANGLPYIRTLEYGGYPNPPKKGKGKTAGGFSKQAPAGMVRTTAAEFDEHVRKVIAK
jgi:2-keto-4-pentenoate hydratase